MGKPYETIPSGGHKASGGESTFFEIPFPSRTSINKIIVMQTAGQLVDFKVALYNNKAAMLGESISDTVGETRGPVPGDMFRVTPDFAGEDGVFVYFLTAEGGPYPFFNHDNDHNPGGGRLGNDRTLYIKLTPEGVGEKEFCILIGGESGD